MICCAARQTDHRWEGEIQLTRAASLFGSDDYFPQKISADDILWFNNDTDKTVAQLLMSPLLPRAAKPPEQIRVFVLGISLSTYKLSE